MSSSSHLIVFNFYSELYVLRKWYYYCPPTKLWGGNAFTGVCLSRCSGVCLSFCSGGRVPCDHYPLCIGPNCTTPSSPGHGSWEPPLVTSGGHNWKYRSIYYSTISIFIMFIVFSDIKSSYAKELITDVLSHFWFKFTVFHF